MAIRKYRINPMTGRLDRVATPEEIAGDYMEHADFDTDSDAIIDKAESVDDGEGNVSTASQIRGHLDNRSNPHVVELTDFGISTGTDGDDINDAVTHKDLKTNPHIVTLEQLGLATGLTAEDIEDAITHKDLKNNPHLVELTDFGISTGTVGADINDAVTKKHDRQHSILSTADHSDVDVDTGYPNDNDLLGYVSASGKWKPHTNIYVTESEWNQNGFENRTDSTITWTDSTPDRTLSIQPSVTGGSFNYYIAGVKYTSTGDTVQITDVEGVHYIYYDGDTLSVSVNPSYTTLLSIIETKALVSVIYWNATDNEGIYIGEERHSMNMSPTTHAYLHFTQGLKYIDGLGLNTLSVDQDGNDNEDAQFGIDSGEVDDEDLFLIISSVASNVGLPIYYMTGSTPTWNKTINAGYSVLKTGVTAEDRLAYNQYTGGSWQLTEVPDKDFMLCHVFASTEKDKQMIAILGQNSYDNKSQAQTGAKSEIRELILNDILFPEIRPIATIIFQTDDSYTNVMKARVISTDEGDDYIDWRSEVISRVEISTTNHNALTGKQGGTTSEYYHLTSADYIELTQWLDNVTLGSDGKLTLVSGTAINEFSIDGTLGDNSDDAVPTEKAVKTYVDSVSKIHSIVDSEYHSDKVEYIDTPLSPTILTGGVISEGTNVGTFKVSALTALIRTSASDTAPLTKITLSEQDNQVISTIDSRYYVILEYNGGSPQIQTSLIAPNGQTNLDIGEILKNSGNKIHYLNCGDRLESGVHRLHKRASELRHLEIASGLTISDEGSKKLSIASGIVYRGINRFNFDNFDTSKTAPDTFTYVHYDGDATGGGTWVYNENQTEIDVDNYNNVATGLSSLAKFKCDWVFIHPDDNCVYIVYGQDDDSEGVISESTVPTLPDVVDAFGILIGRIIVDSGVATFHRIEMVEHVIFSPQVITDHNDASNIQGGTANEYYHLTNTQHTNLIAHLTDFSNPHNVELTDFGIGTGITGADIDDVISKEHTHANKAQLDLVTDGDHDVRKDNPHSVELTDLGIATGTVGSDIDDAVTKKHTRSHAIDSSDDHTSSITEDNIITADGNGLPKDSGKDISTDGTLGDNSDNSVPTEKAVKTYADTKAVKHVSINTPDLSATGVVNYTLVLTDDGKLIDMSDTEALTLTVPANASVAFPIGTTIAIRQKGTGQITITPVTGVTVDSQDGLVTTGQHAMVSILKVATDTWVAVGSLEA